MKNIVTESEVFEILKNNPKNKWRALLEQYVDQESIDEYIKCHNINTITCFYKDVHVRFTLDEADMGTFPFKVGDIVTHKKYPGSRFIIYDYPILDDRYVCLERKDDIASRITNIMYFPANYAIDGILDNGQEVGLDRSEPALFMSSIECHWSYLTKIGNISELSNDDPLYKIYLQCLEWYPHFVYHIKNKDRD